MGLGDKISNKADEMAGKTKAGVGDASNDQSLKNEGHAQQSGANLKQAGEKVKDAFKK
ncbi:CsbD family protein [Brevibacterium ihuae]|uniref:CsbD family protein n=1 Tax=Brevibacterium ihuae TaxID=1631743 RepID=UPI000C79075A|nr:CsbD family protein [Brevibacterium ihuae]